MTRKQKRLSMILGGLAILGLAAGIALYALSDAIVFFYTPSDVAAGKVTADQRFRLGGLVAENSVKRGQGVKIEFVVTDTLASVPVAYEGVLPDLFREGQGIVAMGAMDNGGTFDASEVLAKHDEKYMPPEVVDALKRSGRWKEGGT